MTLQELEGKLNVIFTGSSRDGLKRMFRTAKAPLFRSAEAVSLPDLGDDFVDSRANYLESVTDLIADREGLKLLFLRLCHTPLFLNEIIRGTLVRRNSDVAVAIANSTGCTFKRVGPGGQ